MQAARVNGRKEPLLAPFLFLGSGAPEGVK